MKQTSLTIQKDLLLADGLDYARLRAEGISMLQNLCGDIWTDYNDHDPGVTILEALCYALTDLTNRASQPIADLLTPAPGTSSAADSMLIPAHQAFSNHPVTLNDYKKIVLDQEKFSGVIQDVWVENRTGPEAMAGEYIVKIGLHRNHHRHAQASLPDSTDAAEQEAREQKLAARQLTQEQADRELVHEILRTLNKHRGLGEEFVEVIFLRPHVVSVGGTLEIREGSLPETALADVLWHIDSFLAPTIQSRGLNYLQATQVGAEDIFAGPLLQNKLLQESEFSSQPTLVSPARINSLLTHMESVRSVGELHLYEQGSMTPAELVHLGNDEELVFDAEASLNRLIISIRGISLRFDKAQALHKFWQLHYDRDRSLRSPIPTSKLRFEEPAGRYQNVGHYDSIQRSFPVIYGLGEAGPPISAAPGQRANSLQLKGYLLFFEQIMANFCAQLANVDSLLSVRHQTQSHFAQPLDDVPHLHKLLNDLGYDVPEQESDELVEAGETDADAAPLSRHYLRKLNKLAEDPIDFMQRRDTLLNHMLARFGYSVSAYQPNLTEPEAIRQHGIRVRERLLQNLNAATYHRGAARVAPDDATPDVSGLELFLFLLTGIKYFQLIVSLGETLAELENEVVLHGEPGPASRLEVRGAPGLTFPDFLGLMYRQLANPTLEHSAAEPPQALIPAFLGVPAVELRLLVPVAGQAPGLSPQHQLLNYFRQLDDKLNRFILLDHRTLRPATYDPAKDEEPGALHHSFYEFQVSICLSDFTQQFHQTSNAQYGGTTYSYREYVRNLILTHAPAHLCVNIIWLGYPQMKELELLYVPFVAASGLLANRDGQDQPELPALQQQLTDFLRPYLSF